VLKAARGDLSFDNCIVEKERVYSILQFLSMRVPGRLWVKPVPGPWCVSAEFSVNLGYRLAQIL
jgi:hypothetical protein